MNDKFKEKLKLNIAISEMKNEEMIAMKKHKFNFKKGLGLVACLILGMTGIAYATNLGNIREKTSNFRGLGKGVDSAIKNGYIEETNMDYIKQTTSIKNQEIVGDNVDVQVKVDNFLMDDRNISLEFVFLFGENIDEYVDITNIHNIELKDLVITDEENRNLSECIGDEVFPSSLNKEMHLVRLTYNIYGDDYPKSKEIHLNFGEIEITEEAPTIEERKVIVLTGNWKIDLEVPEKMYTRTDEYYKVISCDNKDFEIKTTKATETGFEIGIIISNTKKSKKEINEEALELNEQYNKKRQEIYEKNGINENSSENEQARANTEVSNELRKLFMENLLNSYIIDVNGNYFSIKDAANGENHFSLNYPNTKSYIENSNGEMFYCSMSPSRKQKGNYLEGNKYEFYDTFELTKVDATDKLTVVLYYYGEPVIIELEKIK